MSDTVSITVPNYPLSNRTPGVFAVVDPSKANTGQIQQRALIIGQKLNTGTAPVGIPRISAGAGDAQQAFGLGSMLSILASRYAALDTFGEVWTLPLADDPASTAGTAIVPFTGPATAAGVFPLYVCGNFIPFVISVGDTPAIMAVNAVAACNGFTDAANNPLPMVASDPTAGTLLLTMRNKGALDFDVRVAYFGSLNGEVVPAGVGYSITLTIGATNPTALAASLANLTDRTYDFVCCPYTDAQSLNAMQGFFSDITGRWSWQSELFGGAFSAYRATFGGLGGFGTTRNDQHVAIIGFFDSPTPAWCWAVDITAGCAVSLRADPGVPLGGLYGGVRLNVLPPPEQSRFNTSERNTLLYDGISTFIVDDGGNVLINRMVTTYQENAAGAPDDSYLDVETMYQLMDVIREDRTYIQSNYNFKKLVADGSRIPPGSNLVTSQTIKAGMVALYYSQAGRGKVQNPDVFAKNLQAQNAGNGTVLLLLPIQLANQLRIVAMNVQFSKP